MFIVYDNHHQFSLLVLHLIAQTNRMLKESNQTGGLKYFNTDVLQGFLLQSQLKQSCHTCVVGEGFMCFLKLLVTGNVRKLATW